jgi:hypothetical protein
VASEYYIPIGLCDLTSSFNLHQYVGVNRSIGCIILSFDQDGAVYSTSRKALHVIDGLGVTAEFFSSLLSSLSIYFLYVLCREAAELQPRKSHPCGTQIMIGYTYKCSGLLPRRASSLVDISLGPSPIITDMLQPENDCVAV